MKFVRDYIFECLRYSQDSNIFTLNSHSLFMTFQHEAFIKIMKFVRDNIFESLRYSQDSNIKYTLNSHSLFMTFRHKA